MIGKEILNYRIIGVIGKGGMGSVYLAEHKLLDNVRVAIKVINADMVNSFTRQMLKQEAEHLAKLRHQNIVGFIEYHIDEEGNLYLIMEYAEGQSLRQFITETNGLIVEERLCPLFEPILDGVGYAHKQGILHCDIKPENVVITSDNSVKILDFGIARVINSTGEDENDGFVMGSPSYMSPEQLQNEHLDERSDIYSLGVLLHVMLTGHTPYDTTTLTEPEITRKVIEEPLPRMRAYYKYVSDAVQKVVDKATAKDPKLRYQSCAEFKKALHRAIYPHKLPFWSKIAAAVAVLAIIGGGWYLWDYNRVKTYYYKDYVERWGILEGIHELSASEHSHSHACYRFVYQKNRLLRVSYVNSFDKLLDISESEYNERATDQEFYYTEDGKVSRIVAKDRSGKSLYVKSYNDKLNTITFQYDDEHGTERTISNKTVGYTHFLEDNSAKGRISRWYIDYDNDGWVKAIHFHDMYGKAVHDENGIYGRLLKHDELGRITEVQYVGEDDQPHPTKWGLGIKRHFYDDADNWERTVYLTIDEEPALDAESGTAICANEYDEYGNQTYQLFCDGDGDPMYPVMHGIAGVHYTYDEHGLLLTQVCLDSDRDPMFNPSDGVATYAYEYDDNGYITRSSFFDADGDPVESSIGCAYTTRVNDQHGNELERWYYGLDDELYTTPGGYAGIKAEFDSIGNLMQNVVYDADQEPTQLQSGMAGFRYEYDERNMQIACYTLNTNLEPEATESRVAVERYEYDIRGNQTRTAYYEADGETPCLNSDHIAGYITSYDTDGNMTEERFFGLNGETVEDESEGYAIVRYTYDDNFNSTGAKYYNANGEPTLVNGRAAVQYINDDQGHVLESRLLGLDGQLATNYLITRYKYDRMGNIIEQSFFDTNEQPVLNYEKFHRITYKYNSRNQKTEQRYYDIDDNLTLFKSQGYAIIRYEYDNRGNNTKQSYFDTDEEPCKTMEGYSIMEREYDSFGNVVKESYFDIYGQPTNPSDMVPVGIVQYDKWGRKIYIAAEDGHGHLIEKTGEGWAVTRYEYDNHNNQTCISYYDEDDSPTMCANGYHKVEQTYDNKNRCTSRAYFDTAGRPCTYIGYHKEVYTYPEHSNNKLDESYYDANGNSVDCDYGFHRIEFIYNDNYTLVLKRKFYRSNGRLILTQSWNGESWVTDYIGLPNSM